MSKRSGRRGAALIGALVVLAVLAVLLVAIAREAVQARVWLQRRGNQAQALWLARAGVELAADELLTNPGGYDRKADEVLPGSQVRIQVRPEPGSSDTFLVSVEARYPLEPPDTVVRTLRRRLRRTSADGRVQIAVLPIEGKEENEDHLKE